MGRFETTSWSLIVAAAGTSPGAREALAGLCEAYWSPLYAYVRSRGYDVDQAADLTQSYFVQFLEKDFVKDVAPERGRFRVFRGGGWHSGPTCARVYYRNALPANWRDFNVGFRCARDVE